MRYVLLALLLAGCAGCDTPPVVDSTERVTIRSRGPALDAEQVQCALDVVGVERATVIVLEDAGCDDGGTGCAREGGPVYLDAREVRLHDYATAWLLAHELLHVRGPGTDPDHTSARWDELGELSYRVRCECGPWARPDGGHWSECK